MLPSGLCDLVAYNTYGCDPYYVKCYDTDSVSPLNGIRVALPSQIGTTGLDPALPQVSPITNVTACLRMS